MRRYCLLLLLFAFAAPSAAQTVCDGLTEDALRDCIRAAYAPDQVLDLDQSKDTLYAVIDFANIIGVTGVTDVYTNRFVPLDGNPSADPSQDIFNGGGGPNSINQEHVWPRSQGTQDNYAESDLHHLFPVHSGTNTARGNDPFGEVDDDAARWYCDGEVNTARPASQSAQDRCSEAAGSTFEPPEALKGDVARALFYVGVIYEAEVSSAFLTAQLSTLLRWHQDDPADEAEQARSARVAAYQGTQNPFVLDAALAERVYVTTGTDTPDVVINEVADVLGSGNFVGEFVELYNAGSVAVDLDGWSLVQSGSSQTTALESPSLQTGSLTLAPGAYAVVGRGSAEQFAGVHGALPSTYFSRSNSSGSGAPQINGGESFVLIGAGGGLVDSFGENGGFVFGSSSRYQRVQYPRVPGSEADAWLGDTSTPTPGEANAVFLAVDDGEEQAGRSIFGAPYPNPARGVVTIPVLTIEDVRAEVFDVLGRRVTVLESEGGALRWDVAGVPSGVYFVRAVSLDGVASTVVTVGR